MLDRVRRAQGFKTGVALTFSALLLLWNYVKVWKYVEAIHSLYITEFQNEVRRVSRWEKCCSKNC